MSNHVEKRVGRGLFELEKPIKRSKLRHALGNAVYGSAKRLWWLKNAEQLAVYRKDEPLEFECFSHKTPLLRQLKDVDMHLQHNRLNNKVLPSNHDIQVLNIRCKP